MNPFQYRLKKIRTELNQQGASALLISAKSPAPKSRDSYFPYKPSSDFYYLTGTTNQDMTLLVSNKDPKPVLFASPRDKAKEIWEGKGEDPHRVAKRIGAELVVSKEIDKDIRGRLKEIEKLYFQNEKGTRAFELSRRLIELPSHQRLHVPHTYAHSDLLLEPLRLVKDSYELQVMRNAAEVTGQALMESFMHICPGNTERQIHAAIELAFELEDCKPAFNSIVATGANAATLHHESSSARLKKGQMLLIDIGAECAFYAADITRVFPVSDSFDKLQSEIYSIVLSAQKAAIQKVKPGVPITTVYEAAARELTIGLKELRVLKGAIPGLLKKKAFLPYFPHSIGHTLGLDVHDIGNLRDKGTGILRAGMVITIEPGLYFSKRTGKIPPCGVRIEDDILVTAKGYEVLTSEIPKEISEVEDLLNA